VKVEFPTSGSKVPYINNFATSTNTSTIQFDLRSFITAAAVNRGIISLTDLEFVSANPNRPILGLYYHLKYEGTGGFTAQEHASQGYPLWWYVVLPGASQCTFILVNIT
jgi:hypothetical protein